MSREKQFLLIAITAFSTVFISSLVLIISNGKTALFTAIVLPCLVFFYCYPRLGLWFFLIYLPFGGTVTYAVAGVFQAVGGKITYAPSYALFHLAKDIFYFPALLAILVSLYPLKSIKPQFKPLIIAFGILLSVCLMTLFFVNLPQPLAKPSDKPFLMGIIGLKVILGYIPLLICGYHFIRQQKDFIWFNRVFVLLVMICCSLCLIQYLLLLQGICPGSVNLPEPAATRTSLQAQCFVGGSLLYNPSWRLLRLPGTFVSPWHWSWFLISGAFITYATIGSDPSRRWRIISGIGLVTVLMATVVSGQNAARLVVPIALLLLLLVTEKRKRWLPLKLILIAIVVAILITQFAIVQQATTGLIQRWRYSPPPDFMASQVQWLTQGNLTWFGNGLGRASSAARRLGRITLIETFYVKLVYEIGIVGCLAFLGLVTTLTITAFKAYRSLKTPVLRHWGLCVWIFILFISYNPYYYPLEVDPVAVYYWFLAGILLKLPVIESSNDQLSEASATSF